VGVTPSCRGPGGAPPPRTRAYAAAAPQPAHGDAGGAGAGGGGAAGAATAPQRRRARRAAAGTRCNRSGFRRRRRSPRSRPRPRRPPVIMMSDFEFRVICALGWRRKAPPAGCRGGGSNGGGDDDCAPRRSSGRPPRALRILFGVPLRSTHSGSTRGACESRSPEPAPRDESPPAPARAAHDAMHDHDDDPPQCRVCFEECKLSELVSPCKVRARPPRPLCRRRAGSPGASVRGARPRCAGRPAPRVPALRPVARPARAPLMRPRGPPADAAARLPRNRSARARCATCTPSACASGSARC
jgi:hypothetical protein